MTATVHPLVSREERAARAALEGLPPEKRRALLSLRGTVLGLLSAERSMRRHNTAAADELLVIAESMDEDVCTLMGFEDFSLVDIPAEEDQ